MTTIATLSVLVDADISRFTSGMTTVNNSIDTTARGMQNLGTSMQTVGQNTAAITLPIVAGLGLAVNAATEFDAAMTNVNSILQNGAADAAALNAEILNIGANAVAGPQAVAEAYYEVVGGVADAANHIPILNAAIATSEAGAANLTATTNVLIGAMNAYGASADDAAHYSDVLTATVAAGVGSMDNFAAAFPAVTGVASSMGIEFDQLGGMMAFLTTRGTSAAEASTQLSGAMISLIRPSEAMQAALESIGFSSGQAAVDALGLQGAYQALADGWGTNFAEITNGVEAMRGAIALTSEGATGFMDDFANSIDGATAAAREVQLQSASNQFSLLQSSLSALGVTLGDSLMISLASLATHATDIATGVRAWAVANPQLAGTIVTVVGGIAGLLAALIPLGMVVSGAGAVIGLLTPVFAALAPVVAAAAFPLAVFATIIIPLVALSGDLPALSTALTDVGTAVGTIISSGGAAGWTELGTSLLALADISLMALADGVINLIGALVGQDFATIGEQWGSIGGMLQAAWDGINVVLVLAEMGIQNAGLQVQLAVQGFIADLRNTILAATGGAIDIAPTIEMDIAATQAQIQANVDEAIASVTPSGDITVTADVTADVRAVAVNVSTEGTTVDVTGVEYSAITAINALNPNADMTSNVTISGSAYNVDGIRTDAVAEVNGIVVDGTSNANVTLTATVDASSAQATITASVAALAASTTVSGAFGEPAVATVDGGSEITVPSGATGVNVRGEGLMYVHANEKLLNAADTELYNNGMRAAGGSSGGGDTYNLALYGTSPMEVFRMVQRASKNAAPG